jgi:hypothetical protein
MNEDFSLAKSVAKRFLRGALAGGIAAMATIAITAAQSPVSSIADLQALGARLLFAAILGIVCGGILAADKYIRAVPADADSEAGSQA